MRMGTGMGMGIGIRTMKRHVAIIFPSIYREKIERGELTGYAMLSVRTVGAETLEMVITDIKPTLATTPLAHATVACSPFHHEPSSHQFLPNFITPIICLLFKRRFYLSSALLGRQNPV